MLEWFASGSPDWPAKIDVSYVDDGFRAPIKRVTARRDADITLNRRPNAPDDMPYSAGRIASHSRIASRGAPVFGMGTRAGGPVVGDAAPKFSALNSGASALDRAAPSDFIPRDDLRDDDGTLVRIAAPADPTTASVPTPPDAAASAAPSNLAVAPLPSTALLLLGGLGGLAALSFRRRF